jgi:DNA uptake protein ComE-like DNA-binding protein
MPKQCARRGKLCRVPVAMLIVLAGGVSCLCVASPVRALEGDLAAIVKASDLDGDRQDAVAVATVCTKCHAASQFLTTPRSRNRWDDVFEAMSGYGATGTDEQLSRVVDYFQKNLTVVNVNTSPPDEIKQTLQLGDDAVAAIVSQRGDHPFGDVDSLSKIAGVNRAVLEKLKAKNCLLF